MRISAIDPADRRLLAEAVAVETRATRAVRPRWVPLPASVRAGAIAVAAGWQVRLHGAFDGDRLVGVSRALVADDAPDVAWLSVEVDPGDGRRGTGSALVRTAVHALPAAVSTVLAQVHRPRPAEVETLVHRFGAPLGFEVATTETVVELNLDRASLADCPAPDGHQVLTFTDGVPDELREQVGRLKGLVDAEAPSGDLHWEPAPVTPEAYAEEICQWQAEGRAVVESVALAPGGRVAAWTCVVVPPNRERAAQVEGTLVLAEYRGRGLGAAVKHANLVALRHRGDVQRVVTSSDDDNGWMRRINDRLGFSPVEVEAILRHRRPTAGA